jgi:signal transduction histidine kinase
MMQGADGEIPEQGRDFLAVIKRNTERLERLVDDLLLVAQLESGTFTLETSDVDLRNLLSGCVEAARPIADDKAIDLTVEAEVVHFAGDQQRLEQLVENLISNALKYTPDGGRVATRLYRENGDVEIEVEDSGIGIAEDEQQFLFDRFFRASTATDGAIPGVGLGLTIVKAIADAHQGTIQVESQEGQGTTFRVQLPLETSLAA